MIKTEYHPNNCGIMLLGDVPMPQEAQWGVPFTGDAGPILARLLWRIGMRRDQFILTYAIKESVSLKDLSEERLSPHVSSLVDDILEYKPLVVVAMGDIPNRMLGATAVDSNLDGRGKASRIVWDDHQFSVLTTLSIRAPMAEWKDEKILEEDLRRAVLLRRKGYQEHNPRYVVVDSLAALKKVFEFLTQAATRSGYVLIDFEGTGLDVRKDVLKSVSFTVEPGMSYVVPIRGWMGTQPWGENHDKMMVMLKDFLQSDVPKAGQNIIAFDALMVRQEDMRIKNIKYDLMLIHHVCDENHRHGLGPIVNIYLGDGQYKDDIKKQIPPRGTFDQIPSETLWAYNATDTEIPFRLTRTMIKEAKRDDTWKVYERISLPLARIMAEAKWNGINIDRQAISEMQVWCKHKVEELTAQCYELAKTTWNIASSDQTAKVLYDNLKLPCRKMTSGGKSGKGRPSVDKEALQSIADLHPVVPLLQEVRKLHHDVTNYLEGSGKKKGLLSHVADDGRVHPDWLVHGTKTGRISGGPHTIKRPQYDADGELVGFNFRRLFIPPPGWVWISADYCQHELRVLAYVAPDHNLIEACKAGDPHRKMASSIYEVSEDRITTEQREDTKRVVFGTNYGRGVYSIARQYDKDVSWAEALQAAYFAKYSGIKIHFKNVENIVNAAGEIVTPFGRKRHLYGIHILRQRLEQCEYGSDGYKRYFGMIGGMYRQAINFTVSVPASDILHLATIRIDSRFTDVGLRGRFVLSHHDAWNGVVPEDELDKSLSIVLEEMCRLVPEVPGLEPKVEYKLGRYWQDNSLGSGTS